MYVKSQLLYWIILAAFIIGYFLAELAKWVYNFFNRMTKRKFKN